MDRLLILVIGGAVLAALFLRHSITPVAARRIVALSALGATAFGLGLFLQLTGQLLPIEAHSWAWTLAVFFLLSLGAAPFGLIPLFIRALKGSEETLAD